MTSCTISQDLRLRHASADARAHAVTDKVASAQDVAAMFLTSDAFRLLCRARAWAEETILTWCWFQHLSASVARSSNVSLAAMCQSARPRFLRSWGAIAQQQWVNQRCLGARFEVQYRPVSRTNKATNQSSFLLLVSYMPLASGSARRLISVLAAYNSSVQKTTISRSRRLGAASSPAVSQATHSLSLGEAL